MGGYLKTSGNPMSHKEAAEPDPYIIKVFTFSDETEITAEDQVFSQDDLAANIQRFITTPLGGTRWDAFAETKQIPYTYKDEEGQEWNGVRPEFSPALQKLDGTEILIQGYMFPLSQKEGQTLFLLGPFPMSCPYHYHVTPSFVIEAHAQTPQTFSYDAVNVKGRLELVPKDDEYNVFYRLRNAELLP